MESEKVQKTRGPPCTFTDTDSHREIAVCHQIIEASWALVC